MTDDPRDILSEAGVEVPEVDAYDEEIYDEYDIYADAAILALARLVAKYKWQRDWALNAWCCTSDTMPERIAITEAAYGDRPYRIFPWNHEMNGHVDCDCALCRDMEGVDNEAYHKWERERS